MDSRSTHVCHDKMYVKCDITGSEKNPFHFKDRKKFEEISTVITKIFFVMWEELEGNYFLLSTFLGLRIFLDEHDHCCNSETREDSLRSYPGCEGIHGRRTFRLRKSDSAISHSASTTLQLQAESGETTQDPGNSAVQLGGRVLVKPRGGLQVRDLGGPDLSSPLPTSGRECLRPFTIKQT